MLMSLLSDHSQKAAVGMVGTGGTSSTAKPSIESLKTAGGTQMTTLSGRVLLLDVVVSDGESKVSAQGGDCLGLGITVLADNVPTAT
jgi:hypothetical protein